MELITTIIISFGTGLAGCFGGWFFGRKRQNIDNIDAAVETWKKVVNSLEEQVEKSLKREEQSRNCIEELKESVRMLRMEVNNLTEKLQKTEKLLKEHNIEF